LIKRKFAVIHFGILMIATLGIFMPIGQASAAQVSMMPHSPAQFSNAFSCSDGGQFQVFSPFVLFTFGDFHFNIPPGDVIDGISVELFARSSAGTQKADINLASGGVKSIIKSAAVGTSFTPGVTFGGSSDTWGGNIAWTSSALSDGTFKVEIKNMANAGFINVEADCLIATVHHHCCEWKSCMCWNSN
jgi:hypothetical protein